MKTLLTALLLSLMTLRLLRSEDVFASDSDRISVAFYNVENLFDVEKDKGKDDWEFLPRGFPGKKEGCRRMATPRFQKNCLNTDWSEEKLSLKISQIKRVMDAMGERPEILGLCEVENEKVLSRLAASLGYSGVLLHEGPDERGIDVALLYRGGDSSFSFQKSTAIPVKFSGRLESGATRDILKAEFKLQKSNERLIIYVNHWPSQGSPSQTRFRAAEVLVEDLQREIRAAPGTHALAIGDFNTVESDEPHPFRHLLTKKAAAFQLHDVHEVAEAEEPAVFKTLPLGTTFYPPTMSWSRFDRIFVSESLIDAKGWEIRPNTYRIFSEDFMTRDYRYREGPHRGSVINGVPKRYETNARSASEAGFSDHFPVSIHLSLR